MDSKEIEERVLRLRETGRSFGAIATELGMDRARLAHDAFRAAVARRSAEEQAHLRRRELARLDGMAKRLAGRSDLSRADLEQKLTVIERLRALLTST